MLSLKEVMAFLMTIELIFGFQILDLKDHFSASLRGSGRFGSRICLGAIVSQPNKCLKFMTFREGCFVIHVEYKHLNEALENFYHHQFYKR